jgi:hypothetical protein
VRPRRGSRDQGSGSTQTWAADAGAATGSADRDKPQWRSRNGIGSGGDGGGGGGGGSGGAGAWGAAWQAPATHVSSHSRSLAHVTPPAPAAAGEGNGARGLEALGLLGLFHQVAQGAGAAASQQAGPRAPCASRQPLPGDCTAAGRDAGAAVYGPGDGAAQRSQDAEAFGLARSPTAARPGADSPLFSARPAARPLPTPWGVELQATAGAANLGNPFLASVSSPDPALPLQAFAAPALTYPEAALPVHTAAAQASDGASASGPASAPGGAPAPAAPGLAPAEATSAVAAGRGRVAAVGPYPAALERPRRLAPFSERRAVSAPPHARRVRRAAHSNPVTSLFAFAAPPVPPTDPTGQQAHGWCAMPAAAFLSGGGARRLGPTDRARTTVRGAVLHPRREAAGRGPPKAAAADPAGKPPPAAAVPAAAADASAAPALGGHLEELECKAGAADFNLRSAAVRVAQRARGAAAEAPRKRAHFGAAGISSGERRTVGPGERQAAGQLLLGLERQAAGQQPVHQHRQLQQERSPQAEQEEPLAAVPARPAQAYVPAPGWGAAPAWHARGGHGPECKAGALEGAPEAILSIDDLQRDAAARGLAGAPLVPGSVARETLARAATLGQVRFWVARDH